MTRRQAARGVEEPPTLIGHAEVRTLKPEKTILLEAPDFDDVDVDA